MEEIMLDDLIIFESEADKVIDPKDDTEGDNIDPKSIQTEVIEDDEETEENEEGEGSQDTDDGDDEGGSDEADYTPYYEFLKENGALIVGDDFEFKGTKEDFERALETDRANVYQNALVSIWDKLPNNFKPLLEYGLKGGTDLNAYLNAYEVDYDKVSIETPEQQRKVIFDYFKSTTKMSDDRINKKIDRYEDLDNLQEEAEEALAQLKDIQAEYQADLVATAEAEAEERRVKSEQTAAKLVTAIDGMTTDSARRNKLKALFFNEMEFSGKRGSELDYKIQSIKSNPSHLAQLGDLFLDYDIEKGFNFDRFLKQGRTQANNSFQKLLEQKHDPQSKVKGSSKNKKENFSLSEWMT